MKNWHENIGLWKELVQQPRFALVTDVDGTISPIVDEPDQAYILPEVRPLIEKLRDTLPVFGVISGRQVEDVRQRVGIHGLVYIGNHGLERYYQGNIVVPQTAQRYRQVMAQAAAEVQAALLPGMMLEDKDLTLTVHYRQAQLEPDVLDEFTQMIKAAAKRLGLNLFEGRKVYELRPPVGVDKGTALANLLKDFNVQAAVYLGDDTTDIAAFEQAGLLRSKGECQVYAIGVLSNNTPAGVLEKADYSAEGVEDVAKFFAFLADSANASST